MGRNNIVGAWGEELAAKYLQKKGYKILAMGFRCRFGEIDIIASNRKSLVFAEVKLRKNDNFANAADFVDLHKQERLRTTASFYIDRSFTKLQPRFDVIEIYAPLGTQTENPEIIHMEAAFE